MRCQPCRDALSARLDGEDAGIPSRPRSTRTSPACAGCSAFAAGSQVLRRRLAVRPADPVPDLSGPILAAAEAARPRRRSWPEGPHAWPPARSTAPAHHWSRWALLAVALTQLAIAMPPMLLGQDADTPGPPRP